MKINKYLILPLTVLACFMWSTAFVGVKIGLKYMNAPYTFAGIRFFIAGLMLVPFSWRRGFLSEIKNNKKLIIQITLLQTFLGYALYYTAMTFVKGSIASIIIGSSPLISAILAHFLMEDDKFSRKKMLTLSMGIIGVVVIMLSTKPVTMVGIKELIGIFFLLGNSSLVSLVNIKVAQEKKGVNPIFLCSNQMIYGGLLLMILGLFVEGKQNLLLPTEFYISLIWLALVSAVAFSIWFVLLQQPSVKVSELNMWKFIIPLSGAILSWTMLPNESPDVISVTGMALILSSLIMYYRTESKAVVDVK